MSEVIKLLLFVISTVGMLVSGVLWMTRVISQRLYAVAVLAGLTGLAVSIVDEAPLYAVLLFVGGVVLAWLLHAQAERSAGKHRIR